MACLIRSVVHFELLLCQISPIICHTETIRWNNLVVHILTFVWCGCWRIFVCLWAAICPGLGGGLDKNSTGIVFALCGRNTLKKSLDMSITSKCIVNFFVSLYLFSSIECSNLILVALHGVERSEIIMLLDLGQTSISSYCWHPSPGITIDPGCALLPCHYVHT